jgi:hypothetical protein
MKPPVVKKGWRDYVRPMTEALHPATFVIKHVAAVAVHVQRPTILGIAGLAATGLSALNEITYGAPAWDIDMAVSPSVTRQAFERAGATVRKVSRGGAEWTQLLIRGTSMMIAADGSLVSDQLPTPELLTWIAQVLDPAIPRVVTVSRGKAPVRFASEETKLARFSTKQGAAIAAATKPMLGGGRCILLEGKPGVGKTTMAQEIARELNLGRIAIIHQSAFSRSAPVASNGNPGSYSPPPNAKALQMLSAGVLILDDVDKMDLSLGDLEELRASTKLLILTANNGQHDEVLDGAFMRAGRVDEVFTVESEHASRRAPFDLLTDSEWDEIGQWPVAYQNEVEKRLTNRPGDIRIDDLRGRLARRTRSGEVLA